MSEDRSGDFSVSGGMAALVHGHDWAATPLGPMRDWPRALTAIVDMMLAHVFPMAVLWGRDNIVIYNDGYRRLIAAKHPATLGRPQHQIWPEIRDRIEPNVRRAWDGESVSVSDYFLPNERYGEIEDAWFDVVFSPLRDDAGAISGTLVTTFETTERVLAERARDRAEDSLRRKAEREHFLLDFTDRLRAIADPKEIMAEASETVGRHLGVGRCGYGAVDPTGEHLLVDADWTDGIMPSAAGRLRLSDFGEHLTDAYRAGKTLVIEDLLADDRPGSVFEAYRKAGNVRACLTVPLHKGGRWVGTFYVQQSQPRKWTPDEEALLTEIAERTWAAVERARAQAALRDSELRFRQFADASLAALSIRDAATLALEYISPAAEAIYGVPAGHLLGDRKHWAALILPEDRAQTLAQLGEAQAGRSVVQEFRILRPSDGDFRWIKFSGFPLFGEDGRVKRLGGIARDVTEKKLAAEHQAVLLAELQHRVRNIMAMVRSITVRTGRQAESVPEFTDLLVGRLLALARVQALLTQSSDASASVHAIVQNEVSAQAHGEDQLRLIGPDVPLSAKAAELLTLAMHELSTNALKYGAFSVAGGCVTVRCRPYEEGDVRWLSIEWVEEGGPGPEEGRPPLPGFGTELIEKRVPYELGGRGKVSIGGSGAQCHLAFPIGDTPSVLSTKSPRRAIVSGGMLDTSGRAHLAGGNILLLSDDYYLASDAANAIRQAGGIVSGPFVREDEALAAITEAAPAAAIIDTAIGGYDLARQLDASGIPLVFVNGEDAPAGPAEFTGVARLERPVDLQDMVGLLGTMLEATAPPRQAARG